MIKTAYFPPLSVVQSLIKAEEIVIDTGEHYQKNSLRNRCYLASNQGKILLSVPLTKGKHQQMPIQDVRIAYEYDWVRQHLRTIENNYKRAPYYEYYMPEIERILQSHHRLLLDLNWEIMLFICRVFRWNPLMAYSIEFNKGENQDIHFFHSIPYPQLFENKFPFIPDLSILDLLFCMGPQIKYILPEE
ncbi:MAG: WbqC family protein [Saprospiraceae bacterium]